MSTGATCPNRNVARKSKRRSEPGHSAPRNHLPVSPLAAHEPPASSVTTSLSYTASYSGIIPDPAMLAMLDQVVPGSANTIIEMAVRQERHRQELEAAVVQAGIRSQRLGLHYGLAIAVVAFVVAAFVAYIGHPIEGTFLGTVDLVGLAGVFVYGSREQRAERREKAALMAQTDRRTRPR